MGVNLDGFGLLLHERRVWRGRRGLRACQRKTVLYRQPTGPNLFNHRDNSEPAWPWSERLPYSVKGYLIYKATDARDVRLPEKGDSNSLGARPVHLIIPMMK